DIAGGSAGTSRAHRRSEQDISASACRDRWLSGSSSHTRFDETVGTAGAQWPRPNQRGPRCESVKPIMNSPLYFINDSPRLNRRSFLFATSSLAAAALWSARAFGAVTKLPRFSDYPFQLGVASGDPASDGFVLWTRLAPKPLEGGGMEPDPVEVAWQVCEDE